MTLFADASILAGTLLELRRGARTEAGTALLPIAAEPIDDRWRVRFRSGHSDEPYWCELLDVDVDAAYFHDRYEASRVESPFNASLMARKNKRDAVIVLRDGKRFVRTSAGIASAPLVDEAAALRDDIGIAPP